jgi:hypothetical protein
LPRLPAKLAFHARKDIAFGILHARIQPIPASTR